MADRNAAPGHGHPLASSNRHLKCFRVTHPGQVVDVKVARNTFTNANTFEVAGEVEPDWKWSEVVSVSFDKELKGRPGTYTPWQPPPPPGSSQTHDDRVTVRTRFAVSEEWKVEAGVKVAVVALLSPTAVGSAQASIRGEYKKQTFIEDEKSVTQKRAATYNTPASDPPGAIRFVRVDLYRTGKAVLLVDGLLVYDVPVETLEDFLIRSEAKE